MMARNTILLIILMLGTLSHAYNLRTLLKKEESVNDLDLTCGFTDDFSQFLDKHSTLFMS
jgi:hypothetical protein